MGYQDSVAGTALSEAFLDEASKQVVMKYATAAARNADAALSAACREGMVSYQDDINSLIVQRDTTLANISTIGPVHGALSTWAPTITQSGTVTYTAVYGTQSRLGRRVFFEGMFTITGTGSGSNNVTITLPVTALQSNTNCIVGTYGYLWDNSAALAYGFIPTISTTSVMRLLHPPTPTGSALASLGTAGFTAALAANDFITVSGNYEAAADA